MNTRSPLRKKLIVLVTGANKGIGLQTCQQLARTGRFSVILTARNVQLGKDAANLINRQVPGNHVIFLPLDVEDQYSIQQIVQTLKKDKLTVDVLINNAGFLNYNVDKEVAKTTMNVNYFGLRKVTEAFLKNNLINTDFNDGRIINVSSQMGSLSSNSSQIVDDHFRDNFDKLSFDILDHLVKEFINDASNAKDLVKKGWPSDAYSFSKCAVNAYTRLVAKELQKLYDGKITCNALYPGWCRTDMGGYGAPRSAEQGAQVVTWLASAPKDEINANGELFGPNPRNRAKF